MKKLLISATIAIMLVLSFNVFADGESVNIYINDSFLQGQNGILVEGTTMIPVRVIAETLGCQVDWEESEQSIVISKSGLWIGMNIGSTEAYDVLGNKYTLPVAPILYNDSVTMIPARFVSENLGRSVKWDDATRTVFINSDSSFANFTNTPEYKKTVFDNMVGQLEQLNKNGDFYQAQEIIGSVTDDMIDAVKNIDANSLEEFYSQRDITERNIQLMAEGQPNEIEQELNETKNYLNNAITLYNNGMYFEAGEALSDFYKYRTTPELIEQYNNLVNYINEQIAYLPYKTLENIKQTTDNGDYYGAFAQINAFLQQDNLNDDLIQKANELKNIISQDIADYERAQEVVGYRYITNVSHAVNFRQEANESSQVLATIPYATRVGYVQDQNNEYARIQYNGMFGYVSRFYLTDTMPSTEYYAVRYILNATNILEQPKYGAGVLTSVPSGTAVGLVEVAENGFVRVDYNGNQGYVPRSDLTLSKQ